MPKQRNGRDENDAIKAGKTPEGWQEQPAKYQQKDKDARWTKKHGKSNFGYKNHVNADAKHKIIRRYCVTTASVHDSREFEGLLDSTNTSRDVFGAQEMAPGGRQVRTIGIERAATKIGLQNLVYNIRRLVSLQRMAPACLTSGMHPKTA